MHPRAAPGPEAVAAALDAELPLPDPRDHQPGATRDADAKAAARNSATDPEPASISLLRRELHRSIPGFKH